MAVTKTARTLQSSTSNAAGATTTGTALDLSTALGLSGVGIITNGGTGPTVGCTFSIEWSPDNTNWYTLFSLTAPTTNSAVTSYNFEISPNYKYVRSKFTGNTAQAVSVECQAIELTSV